MTDTKLLIKALNLAYFYLKFRSRTKREIEKYLQQKSEKFFLTKTIIAEAVNQLIEEGLIDDKKFIELFVASRNNLKPKGRSVLTYELMRLGIEKDLIVEYFEKQPPQDYELAVKALALRWPRWRNLPKLKRLTKAYAFLGRRGFSFMSIRKAVDVLSKR